MDVITPAPVHPAAFSIADVAGKLARQFGAKAAFVGAAGERSFAELHARSGRLAALLTARGVESGDRVVIIADNRPEHFELLFACAALGAIEVPLNTRLNPKELAYQLADCGAVAALIASELRESAERSGMLDIPHWFIGADLDDALDAYRPMSLQRADADLMDPLVIMYTSGTTGYPKGCVLTSGGWVSSAASLALHLGLGPSAVLCGLGPFFHAFSFGYVLAALMLGGTAVISDRATPESVNREYAAYRPTSAQLAHLGMLAEPQPQITLITWQAGKLTSAGAALIREKAPNAQYRGVYGATEAGNIVIGSTGAWEESRPGTIGHPLFGAEVRVVDDEDRPIPHDGRAVGHLHVRSQSVTTGYWNRPEATAELLAGGWLRTGDLASIDAEGYVFFADRSKDMIKTGGENVYSAEVERVLDEHPDVLEGAAYGVPDERWGEAVKVSIVLRPGSALTPEGLDAVFREELAHYKRPRWYDVRSTPLPRSAVGKVLKNDLRAAHDPARDIRLAERS